MTPDNGDGRDGPSFYDDASVLATYSAHRARPDNPNDTLELPVVRALLGEVRGLTVLDLGCGDGRFGKLLLDAGVTSYQGVDGSRNMIDTATRTLRGTAGTATLADIRSWAFPNASVDCVTARLVLHYVEDIATLFRSVRDALKPGGRFVFSVEHPVITSSDKAWGGEGLRQDWIVDDYFVTGRRVTNWLGSRAVKYHRTVEDYFATLQSTGLAVEALRESRPERARFTDDATFARRQRIPLFLIMAAQRNES